MEQNELTASAENVSGPPKDELELKYDALAFPTLVTRIKALFIDLVFILVIFTATSLFVDNIIDLPGFIKGFIFIFMIYLYDPVLISFTGSTLGHKMMKLKVKDYGDPERNLTLPKALLRFLIKGLLGWISFLTVTSNSHKRAMHDLASGSIVLVEKRG
jgi:uncharacterized RDD family membrane protein YckC